MIIEPFNYRSGLFFVVLCSHKNLLALLWQRRSREKHVVEYPTLKDVAQSSVNQRPWALVDTEDLLEVINCQAGELEAILIPEFT